MYHKKNGLKGPRNGWEVELAVSDVELRAALTTGGLIGTTGGKFRQGADRVPSPHSTSLSYLISTVQYTCSYHI